MKTYSKRLDAYFGTALAILIIAFMFVLVLDKSIQIKQMLDMNDVLLNQAENCQDMG